MSVTRSRKEELKYKRYLKTIDRSICVFCEIKTGSDQLVTETKYFKIIYNTFPYSVWDGQTVVRHLMVTPKKHTDSLSKMSDMQKIEYVDLIESYEKEGYNIYARAPLSKIKSVSHQHTHLVKTRGDARKLIFLIRKPYIRITK